MNKKHVFIMKPNLKDTKIETMIVSIMQGYHYEIKYTKYSHHAIKIAKECHNCRIYAVGGDGLIHEIVQGIVGSDNELVVIPAGTGNDFIRSIADSKDPGVLLRKSLSLKAQPIDLIKANDIYCINVLCCAFDSDIANNVHNYRKIKFLPKTLQYVNVLIKRISKYRFYPTKVISNNKVIYNGDLVVCAFCNGRYFGGGFEIGKDANVQDGFIDLNFVSTLPKRLILYYIFLMLKKRLDLGKLYFHDKLKSVDLITREEVNIDGESYQPGRYHLEIVSDLIRVVIYK